MTILQTARTLLASIAVISVSLLGCTTKMEPVANGGATSVGLPAHAILAKAPSGAKPLPDVKASAKKGDTVTFTARIGGRDEPFVEGRAMMVVIDPAIPSCADTEGDGCKTPWDYCCETSEDIVRGTATVQFVGADGKPLAVSLQGQHGLDPLATVTVVGVVAEKDDDGVFIVNATGVHVQG